MKLVGVLTFVALLLYMCLPSPAAAQGSDVTRALQLINARRVQIGLVPLEASPFLAQAAQAHADDMARSGTGIGHFGSDGSSPATRMLRAGYHSYSWGPFVGENWAAYQTIEESVNWWMGDAVHRDNVLRPAFREIGVGVARSPLGFPIVVADFGAQPNVLPVWMSGGGSSVTLILSNEDAAPAGDGPNVMGRAVQAELATGPDLADADTVPFASSLTFESPDGKPVTKIYVRLRDAQGRTVVTMATGLGLVAAPAAVGPGGPPAAPSVTRTRTPRPTATWTAAPSAAPSGTAAPTLTPASSPTFTPTSTATPGIYQGVATAAPVNVSSTPTYSDSFTPLARLFFGAAALASAAALLASRKVFWR